RGPNEPITAEDLRKVLDNEQVRQMAEKLGVRWNALLDQLRRSGYESQVNSWLAAARTSRSRPRTCARSSTTSRCARWRRSSASDG
ncbi:hypothetical protein CTI14_66215, partial [Methylobacterium radiotolerans]